MIQLVERKRYNEATKNSVLRYLREHAHDTFLWTFLVCQYLDTVPRYSVLAKLNTATLPPGLDELYKRMLRKIASTDDANLGYRILALATVVYEPVRLGELVSLVDILEDVDNDTEALQDAVNNCSSFLTVQHVFVYFVHQYAQDFLLFNAPNDVFPSGMRVVHRTIFSRSLQLLDKNLRRDLYSLQEEDIYIGNIQPPDPDPMGALYCPC